MKRKLLLILALLLFVSSANAQSTITVYAKNEAGWDNTYYYYWTDFGDINWPGAPMDYVYTDDSGQKVYKATIPDNAKGVIFTNGATSGLKQTVNITENVADNAFWHVKSTQNSEGKYEVEYLGLGQFSGTCGDGVTWTFDSSTLTISYSGSGTGAMADYSFWELPWLDYCSSITTVVIQSGVTTIGKNAFNYCNNLTSVSIPASVTSIGEGAFEECFELESITIPDAVTSIGNGAFKSCTKLTSITIPDAVTSISNSTFEYCSMLTSVNIGRGVTSIGSGATNIGESVFKSCSKLANINVATDNTTFSSENGVLFNKNKTTLLLYPRDNSRTSYTIPSSVNTINEYAFCISNNLTDVTIHDGVLTIGRFAFRECSSLTSINVDGSNPNYSSDGIALFNKDKSAIIVYPNGKTGAYTIPNSVTTIKEYAFYKCVKLTSITLSPNVSSMEPNAFWYCTGLTSITIPEGVTVIGESAFQYCANTNLTSLTIPSSVTIIDDEAFSNCGGLTSVTFADDSQLRTLGSYAFGYCSNLASITLTSNPVIKQWAFYSIKSGASVTMNLKANEGADGEYWMTFYNENSSFEVPSTGTKIFKAALTGSSLELTELATDKIVKKNNAAILKSKSSPIALTLSKYIGTNDFTGNNLQGVKEPDGLVADNTSTTYVLNKTEGNGVGFYKLKPGKIARVGKAYLTYSGTLAREFFGFDESTRIQSMSDVRGLRSDVWYTIDGRRLQGKPTTKGLYIINGKKTVIE